MAVVSSAFLSLPAGVPYSPVTCNVPCCCKSVTAPRQSVVDVYKLHCAMFGGFFPSLNKMKGLTFPWGKSGFRKQSPMPNTTISRALHFVSLTGMVKTTLNQEPVLHPNSN